MLDNTVHANKIQATEMDSCFMFSFNPFFWRLLKIKSCFTSGLVGFPKGFSKKPTVTTRFFYRPDALPVAQPTVSKH